MRWLGSRGLFGSTFVWSSFIGEEQLNLRNFLGLFWVAFTAQALQRLQDTSAFVIIRLEKAGEDMLF